MVPPCSDRVSRVPPYSRTERLSTRTGLSPAMARLSRRFRFLPLATGLVRVRSPLLAESRLMSFPPGTEMFQFPGFASAAYGFSGGYSLRSGLPHSEIPGSKPARGSPKAFRSVPRPSSPLGAKASTRCPCFPRPPPAATAPDLVRRCTAPAREKAAAGLPEGNSSDNTTKAWSLPAARRRPGTKHTHANDASARRRKDQERAETRDLPVPATHDARKDRFPHARTDGHLVTTSRCPNNTTRRPARHRRRSGGAAGGPGPT